MNQEYNEGFEIETQRDELDELDGLPDSATVLWVRHGKQRGPRLQLEAIRKPYLEPLRSDLVRRRPAIGRRIRVWETGTRFPDLTDVRAIVFLLQDPLHERFPDCFAEAADLAAQARRAGIALVNPPDALSNSVKSAQSLLWRQAGISTPVVRRYDNHDHLYQIAEELGYPLIVRSNVLHVQAGMRLCTNENELRSLIRENPPTSGAVAQFVDTRQGYQQLAPGTVWADYFHKQRVMVYGNHVVPNHLFFSRQPFVGVLTSSFRHWRSLRLLERWSTRVERRKHLALDYAYSQAPLPHPDLFRAASRALGLEFVAIDCSTLADGSVVLWEANPHFSIHDWPIPILKRRRFLAERLRRQHDAMGELFADLLCKSDRASMTTQPWHENIANSENEPITAH